MSLGKDVINKAAKGFGGQSVTQPSAEDLEATIMDSPTLPHLNDPRLLLLHTAKQTLQGMAAQIPSETSQPLPPVDLESQENGMLMNRFFEAVGEANVVYQAEEDMWFDDEGALQHLYADIQARGGFTGFIEKVQNFAARVLLEEKFDEAQLEFWQVVHDGGYNWGWLRAVEYEPSELDFSGRSYYRSNFSQVDLQGADMWNTDLRQCDFAQANLKNVRFGNNARLDGSSFVGANCENFRAPTNSFGSCNFFMSNLTGARLTSRYSAAKECSIFARAILKDADLRGINWAGGWFKEADLSGANFENAVVMNMNLNGAVLSGTSLQVSRLSYTDFTDAIVEGAKIWGAHFAKQVVLPDGKVLSVEDYKGSYEFGKDVCRILAEHFGANLDA